MVQSASLDETEKIAQQFVAGLEPEKNTALVFGLSGDLGSGKTTFTQAVARVLGVPEKVTSPTFVIEKIYELSGSKFKHFIHIDAYRLTSGAELASLGWEEVALCPDNLVFIEWPEHVSNVLPKTMKKIFFRFVDQHTREINFE